MKGFAEFFAGVGLVRKGLESSGWQCLWANDISPDKQAIYAANFGAEHFVRADIWDLAAAGAPSIPEDVFLFTASFPCTDLSLAGARAGLAGAESGTLNALLQILQAQRARQSAPRVVMLENVRGFLTSHQGRDVATTVQALNQLGYWVDLLEVDACHFTAQSRPRVFLLAVEESLARRVMTLQQPGTLLDAYWQVFDRAPLLRPAAIRKVVASNPGLQWAAFDLHFQSQRTQVLDDIVELISPASSLWWDQSRQRKLVAQMSERHRQVLDQMVVGERVSYGTVYRRVRNGQSMAELRNDGVAGCLRTPRGGSSKQILIAAGQGDLRVRHMTAREYARLQGLGDEYRLPEGTPGYFAMGDAVCVPVIEYIAREILEPLYRAGS